MDEAEEVFEMAFVANHQAAEILQPSEEPLNLPSPAVTAQRATILSEVVTVGPMRGDELDSLFEQRLIQPVAVVSHIADKPRRRVGHKSLFQRGRPQRYLVGRSTCDVRGERKTLSVRHCHELRALAPLGFADAQAPFFAGAKLPSMKHSSSLIPPRSYRSWARTSSTARNAPERTHC